MRRELDAEREKSQLRAADAAIRAAHEEAKRKEEEESRRIYKEASELYGGLSRANLLSDEWHAEHTEAAKHLFGFKTWYETRAYVWALFDVKRPVIKAGQ